MKTETLESYLQDLSGLLTEKALDARRQAKQNDDPSELKFAQGRLMALIEVLSLMQLQAKAFGIDGGAIGLADFDPEAELLAP